MSALVDHREKLGAELVAAVGAVVLLITLLTPVAWIHEESTGGFTGGGIPGADRDLTAWDAFGGWLIPAAVAAAMPLLGLASRPFGRRFPWEIRIVVVVLGLAVLFIATWSELATDLPPCCDMVYVMKQPRVGFLLAGIGGTLLLFGTLASWPRRFPWEEQRGPRAERIS